MRLADEVRDVWLRDQGFWVLRLPNGLVIAPTELAVARIRDAMTNSAELREAVALRATPLIRRCFATPPSPPRGEGPRPVMDLASAFGEALAQVNLILRDGAARIVETRRGLAVEAA